MISVSNASLQACEPGSYPLCWSRWSSASCVPRAPARRCGGWPGTIATTVARRAGDDSSGSDWAPGLMRPAPKTRRGIGSRPRPAPGKDSRPPKTSERHSGRLLQSKRTRDLPGELKHQPHPPTRQQRLDDAERKAGTATICAICGSDRPVRPLPFPLLAGAGLVTSSIWWYSFVQNWNGI